MFAIVISTLALIVAAIALWKVSKRPALVNRVINIVDGGGVVLATIAADGTVTKVIQ